jgi:hypothetical protein
MHSEGAPGPGHGTAQTPGPSRVPSSLSEWGAVSEQKFEGSVCLLLDRVETGISLEHLLLHGDNYMSVTC